MKNNFIRIISFIFAFLFPLFFLNLTPEAYEYNKMFLLVFFSVFLLTAVAFRIIKQGKVEIYQSAYFYPLFVLSVISVISLIFQSPNIAISLTTPLSTSTILAGFLLYLSLNFSLTEQDKQTFMHLLILDGLLISLYLLFSFLGIIPKTIVTPLGNILTTLSFLIIIEIYLLYKVFIFFRSGDRERHQIIKLQNWQNLYLYYGVALFIISITLIVGTIHILTDQSPILLPLSIGWSIMLEVLKNIKTLFLGIGPSNFITAFTLGKPLAINQTPVWNIIFTSSSSYLLNITTELGFLAGFAFLYIAFRSVVNFLRISRTSETAHHERFIFHIMLFIALLWQMIFPSGMTLFILTIILLAFVSEKKKPLLIDFTLMKKLSLLLLTPFILFLIITLYFGGRAYLAEVKFKHSLDSLLNNKGTDAYNLQREAIRLNPFIDRYHTALSQTNLSLANALSSKKTLTGEDSQNIPRLVQQAIDEARTAVNLSRTNVVNWDNLVKTYTAIISYAAGAENWAIQGHQQKIALDPLSPKNRVALAVLYLELNKNKEAEEVLRSAIYLKPDLPISHFNLAIALRKQNRFTEAYQELFVTNSLLPLNSPDTDKVQEELKLLPKEVIATGSLELKKGTVDLPAEEVFDSSQSGINVNPTSLPTIEIKP